MSAPPVTPDSDPAEVFAAYEREKQRADILAARLGGVEPVRVCACGARPDGTEGDGTGDYVDDDGAFAWICYACWCTEDYGRGSVEALEARRQARKNPNHYNPLRTGLEPDVDAAQCAATELRQKAAADLEVATRAEDDAFAEVYRARKAGKPDPDARAEQWRPATDDLVKVITDDEVDALFPDAEVADRARFEAAISEVTPSGKVLFDEHPKRLKLDPDLTDGQNYAIHDAVDAGLLDLIKVWFESADDGEGFKIEVVRMSEREAGELKDL